MTWLDVSQRCATLLTWQDISHMSWVHLQVQVQVQKQSQCVFLLDFYDLSTISYWLSQRDVCSDRCPAGYTCTVEREEAHIRGAPAGWSWTTFEYVLSLTMNTCRRLGFSCQLGAAFWKQCAHTHIHASTHRIGILLRWGLACMICRVRLWAQWSVTQ
jgi:hypothetical protein